MRKESLSFLESYLNNASPTGFESPGQKMWLEYLKPYVDEYRVDTYGTVVGVINPEAEYKVVIEAHADEISWFVKYINEQGFIYVERNGGSDHQIAPSKRVNLHTANGVVKGVFGWPAIHVRDKAKEEQPSMKNIFIDVGCSTPEEVAELGIHVGTVATFDDDMMMLNGDWVVGRALDNRIGGFMIAEVARMLKENKKELPFGLYIVNAVQEEVGLRGAEMIAKQLNANVAIVTDVCHDTQAPMYDKIKSGDVSAGKGPVVTYGPAVQNNLLNMVIDTAKTNDIAIQRQAANRATGTDTDAFAYNGLGTAAALISLPLRYMHTTNEMVHIKDVEAVISLMYEFVIALESGHDFRYFS